MTVFQYIINAGIDWCIDGLLGTGFYGVADGITFDSDELILLDFQIDFWGM